MIKAVIFDLDGTVAYTLPEIRKSVNLTMEKQGFPTRTLDQIRLAVGNGGKRLIAASMPPDKAKDPEALARACADYLEIYTKICLETKTAYDGVVDAMNELRNRLGLKIGILSNKGDALAKPLVESLVPKNCVDAVQGAVSGVPKKPAKELTDRLLERLGVSASEAVMVGDSDVDFQTAVNAGMKHVGVTWGYRDRAFLEGLGIPILIDKASDLVPTVLMLKSQ